MNVCKVLLRECVRQTDKAYTYMIPEDLEGKITEGSYVKVPRSIRSSIFIPL